MLGDKLMSCGFHH